MARALTKETPSPPQGENAEGGVEETDRKGKRPRKEEEASSDSDSEDGRRIRQRLQNLVVKEDGEGSSRRKKEGEAPVGEEDNDSNENQLGLRQAVPQQPPTQS
ncbi:sulfatase [Corchorus olitorius]|uniref:Sulfatase n=1 Tax=Corchorus olitorius TaxID=93759 RepID=A0A1R3J0T0_9ROSI|nr:sulfatase [Corchorus olitorius]